MCFRERTERSEAFEAFETVEISEINAIKIGIKVRSQRTVWTNGLEKEENTKYYPTKQIAKIHQNPSVFSEIDIWKHVDRKKRTSSICYSRTGSVCRGLGQYFGDFTKTQITTNSGTFGSAKKLISTECAKTDKLGPGCYDCIDSYESPRRKVNGLGSTWGKAPRPVVDTIDTATKKETVSNVQVETAAAGTGMGSAMSTEKDLDEAHFDWKWYRTQYHEMVMHKDNALKSPLRSSIISNKFVAIAQSPTHNKSSHHFGASPRFKDLNTDPAMLSSFKGCRPTSVKQILS